jgi:SulP family sulfate permease
MRSQQLLDANQEVRPRVYPISSADFSPGTCRRFLHPLRPELRSRGLFAVAGVFSALWVALFALFGAA